MKPIGDIIGISALLEQTAEECNELAKACLKLSRKFRNENPTPLTFDEIMDNLNEEFVCFDLPVIDKEELRQANIIDPQTIESIYATKEKRWYERLKEAGEETE